MIRRLILMRHGHASPDGEDDHSRPLTERGRDEARRVARSLEDAEWLPDAVRGSDARRTQQTWVALAERLSAPRVSWTRSLYMPTLDRLVVDAAGWDDEDGTVLCLGHNPGWSDIATRLSVRPVSLGTAHAALLQGEGDDWVEAFTHPWTLARVLTP